MKRLMYAIPLLFAMSSMAMAEYDDDDGCQGNCPMGGDTTINNINVPIAKGGDAYAKGGDAYSKSEADAHAYASAGASAFGYVKGGDQYQKAYQSLFASFRNSNYQSQGQLGIVKNVGPQVVITDESTVIYEQKYQAPSMVAPGIDTSQIQVKCPLYVQDGWSGSLSGPGAGGSLGATDAEAIPTCFALLAFENSTGKSKEAAGTAFYCLAFEAAGVDSSECDGWRDEVRGGPAPTVRDVEVREGR